MDDVILQTPRLTLRTIPASFATQVLDFVVRNYEFHRPWDPLVSESFFTFAAQQERLHNDEKLRQNDLTVRLWMFAYDDTHCEQVIGYLSFANIIRGAFQSCHLGYKIDYRMTNKGLMTEALREAIRFAFEELRLHRIEANIMPRNMPSRRVVAKLGFENEGLARQYLKINGVWEDHLHYVILNPSV